MKKRTSQLARANESLLSSNVELQQFAYVASHDLQAPLRTIAVYAGFLKSDCGGQLGEEANQAYRSDRGRCEYDADSDQESAGARARRVERGAIRSGGPEQAIPRRIGVATGCDRG